jgi:hypothetical protein
MLRADRLRFEHQFHRHQHRVQARLGHRCQYPRHDTLATVASQQRAL